MGESVVLLDLFKLVIELDALVLFVHNPQLFLILAIKNSVDALHLCTAHKLELVSSLFNFVALHRLALVRSRLCVSNISRVSPPLVLLGIQF